MSIGINKKTSDSSWRFDLIPAGLAVIVGTAILVYVDAFDYLHGFTRRHEEWELDEFVLGGVVLAFASAWFAWRRQREAERHLGAIEDLQQNLRDRHDELTHLISAAPGALYVFEASENFDAVYVSPAIESLVGYGPEKFIRNSTFWIDQIHPDDKERILGEWGVLFKYNEHVREYRFRHADGSYRWLRAQLKLYRDEAGKPERVIGFCYDISEQKEFEQLLETTVETRTAELKQLNTTLQTEIMGRKSVTDALKEKEEESARMIENLPGFIYTRDYGDGNRVRYVSKGVETMLGYAPVDIVGDGKVVLKNLIHPDDQPAIAARAKESLPVRKSWESTYRLTTASGEEKWLWERARGVYDESGAPLQIEGYVEDITERKQIEEQLRQAQKNGGSWTINRRSCP